MPGSLRPGHDGNACALTVCFARILSPMTSTARAGGPTKTTPASAQACAKAVFSDRKP
jgi:hypothetical protein